LGIVVVNDVREPILSGGNEAAGQGIITTRDMDSLDANRAKKEKTTSPKYLPAKGAPRIQKTLAQRGAGAKKKVSINLGVDGESWPAPSGRRKRRVSKTRRVVRAAARAKVCQKFRQKVCGKNKGAGRKIQSRKG